MEQCDEQLVDNTLSRFGLRTLHLMRMGGPVNLERWLNLCPEVCRESLSSYRAVEESLGVHHLFLFWPAREITHFRYPDGSQADGVFWWIGKSWYDPAKTASIREAADWASMTYEMAFHQQPQKCLVGKIQEGWNVASGQCFDVDGGRTLQLIEEPWVPKGFVIIL